MDHAPCLARWAPHAPRRCGLGGAPVDAGAALPLNTLSDDDVLEFETALFRGRACVRVAGLPSSDARYFFAGRRRKMQVCIQGEFKQRVRFDKVLNGQEFSRPFVNVPARGVISWALGLIKHKLPSAFRRDIFGERPYFLSPLAADMQEMSIDAAGARPPQDGAAAPRAARPSTRAARSRSARSARTAARSAAACPPRRWRAAGAHTRPRRAHADRARATFNNYQHYFGPHDYCLDLVLARWDITRFLGDAAAGAAFQPLSLCMAKRADTASTSGTSSSGTKPRRRRRRPRRRVSPSR